MKILDLEKRALLTIATVTVVSALSGCSSGLDREAKKEINEAFQEQISLTLPNEDSRQTYKKWASRTSTGGILETAYSFRSNYNDSNPTYKFLKKHDLIESKKLQPPSRRRRSSQTFDFKFFKPKIKHLIRDAELQQNSFTTGSSFIIPVGQRVLSSISDINLEEEIRLGDLKIETYDFKFTYKLRSIHPLFEAPCENFEGNGQVSHVDGEGWDLGTMSFGDNKINEFTKEQKCRKGKAFDFPEPESQTSPLKDSNGWYVLPTYQELTYFCDQKNHAQSCAAKGTAIFNGEYLTHIGNEKSKDKNTGPIIRNKSLKNDKIERDYSESLKYLKRACELETYFCYDFISTYRTLETSPGVNVSVGGEYSEEAGFKTYWSSIISECNANNYEMCDLAISLDFYAYDEDKLSTEEAERLSEILDKGLQKSCISGDLLACSGDDIRDKRLKSCLSGEYKYCRSALRSVSDIRTQGINVARTNPQVTKLLDFLCTEGAKGACPPESPGSLPDSWRQ